MNKPTKTGVHHVATKSNSDTCTIESIFMTSSAQVRLVVVELEVNERAQHLKIGDEGVHLGDLRGISVEVAGDRFRIALLQIADAGVVCASLGAQIGRGMLDLIVAVGH